MKFVFYEGKKLLNMHIIFIIDFMLKIPNDIDNGNTFRFKY